MNAIITFLCARSIGTVTPALLRGILPVCCMMLFLLCQLSPSRARADEPAADGSATVKLENVITVLPVTDRILRVGRETHGKLFLVPDDAVNWPAVGTIPVAGPSPIKRPPATGKITVAGGLGKSVFAVSAELYDAASHSWLTKGRLDLGRWQHSRTLPLNGRVLVWGGIVVPF